MKLRVLLKRELNLRNWSQVEGAKQLGLAQATLSNLLKGKHGTPSFSTLDKLSRGLGIDSGTLMEATREEASATESERGIDGELRHLKRELEDSIAALFDAETGKKKEGLDFYKERLGYRALDQTYGLPGKHLDLEESIGYKEGSPG